jgi:hypothetical protein
MAEFNIDHPKPNQVNGTYREPPPANKDVQISLLFLAVGYVYQVRTVVNTTWYKPGDWLTEPVVAEICKIPRWTVTIDSYELMKKVFDIVGPKLSIL